MRAFSAPFILFALSVPCFLIFPYSDAQDPSYIPVTFELDDEVPANTLLGNISTKSALIPPPRGPEGYKRVIVEPHRLSDYLSINRQTSALTAIKAIDRDEICKDLNCCQLLKCVEFVTVFIQRSNQRSDRVRVNVTIVIKDENDNSPEFSNNGVLHLPESTQPGKKIPLPRATDKDSLKNGVLRYKIEDPSSTFDYSGDRDKPMLRLLKKLDADDRSKASYVIKFIALDGGNPERTGTIDLRVTVDDENDNSPVFSSASRILQLPENKPVGSEVHTFRATDADVGEENKRISYSLDSVNSEPRPFALQRFAIDSSTGVLTVRSALDFDKPEENSFKLVILAKDNGSPVHSTSMTFSIVLTNVNDNDPVISKTNQKTQQLVEEKEAGQQVLTISVHDPDELSSNNVECSLRNGQESGFRIKIITQNHLFDILTTKVFDYEKTREVSVTVVCDDKTPPARTVQRTFILPVVDVNDHHPVFQQTSYNKTLLEDAPLGQEVLTVLATDKDHGDLGRVRYSLDAEGSKYFKVDRDRGVIYVNSTLDREASESIHFFVWASDSAKPPRKTRAAVTVVLRDVNDNQPALLGPSTVDVVENAPIGTQITRVRFADPDAGRNGAVSFRLVPDNNLSNKYLNLTADNRVVVIAPIDREVTSRMFLAIEAQDHGTPVRQSKVSLIVRVLDINDNPPELFTPKPGSKLGFSPPLFADSRFNSTVAMLVAKDEDAGENGTVRFELKDTNGTGMFRVDSVTGRLYSAWRYPAQPGQGIYFVRIRLSDMGPAPLHTDAQLYISVAAPKGVGGAGGLAGAGVSNVIILVLILTCSVAIATALIIAILWARSRSKRPLGGHHDAHYDAAVKKAHGANGLGLSSEADSEVMSNAELVAMTTGVDTMSSLGRSHKTPSRLSHYADYVIPYQMTPNKTTSRSPLSFEVSRAGQGVIRGARCG